MTANASGKGGPARVIGLVIALFFAFGFCTVLVDTIIPKQSSQSVDATQA